MSTNFVLNESLMIRDRLQGAYREIIFFSDNAFAHDINYKKANQVLYARIKKLEENPEFDRPRSVLDVIPNSNLAKYGEYQYNEARERSYTTGVNEVSFHYPCIYKSETIKEPWMLPEVEYLFIHTAFSSSYNFNLYEAQLEQLEKLDLIDETAPGVAPACCTGDFHKVNPIMDQLFDRTPGKSYGNVYDQEVHTSVPYYFNVQEYDDVLLRRNIVADVVRELWNKPKLENQDKLMRIQKSSLENLFVYEKQIKFGNSLKSIDTERSLQKLVDSILNLNEKVPKIATTVNETETFDAPPTRRLYSDVLQGNKSPTKSLTEVLSPTDIKENLLIEDILTPQKASSSFFSLDNSPLSTSSQCYVQHPNLSPTNIINPVYEESPTKIVSNQAVFNFFNNSPNTNPVKANSVKYSYSTAVNNASNYPASQASNPMFVNDNSMYDNSFRNNNSTSSLPNAYQNFQYNPFQYVPTPTTVYNNTPYRPGFTNTTFTGTYTNPQMPATRQNLNTNACQQHAWFFPTYRPPNLCSYGNFLGQLLVPQMPTKHTRWSNPHYGRPATPQNIYQPVAQNWGMQNVFRSNSNQQMSTYPTYDNQKNKSKKSPTLMCNNNAKPVRSKTHSKKSSVSSETTFPGKTYSKTNSDYKLIMRNDSLKEVDVRTDGASSTTSTIRNFDVESSSIPVSCSASDDLEKLALREYQSSNDMFFTEIERQATEQYDGNPENSCCPPNKHFCLGGHSLSLINACKFSNLYISFNTCFVCSI